jgi:sugar lactone lactonase YvrE
MNRKLSRIAFAVLTALSLTFPLPAEETAPSVQQLERTLTASPDHPGIWIELAAAYARAGNAAEAARWVEKALARGIDFDLAGNPAFKPLLETPSFKPLLARAAANQRVVSRSKVAFRVPEKDLIPEGIAHDARTGSFFLGSLYKRKIVRIDKTGKASDFSKPEDGLWDVLGMKVDPARRTLWVCSAAGASAGEQDGASGLFRYDLATGRLVSRHLLPGKPQPHLLNDVALGRNGEVFVTDSKGGGLYRLRPGQEQLEVFVELGTLIYPNGVALSPDGKKLFVADFAKGLSVVDVASRQVRPLPHPERVNVAGIDGLYLYDGSLVAVQNSAGTERIVRFRLRPGLDAIESEEILESRNPLFVIPTTGTLAGGSLVYIANSQLESLDDQGRLKPGAKLEEPVILMLPLPKAV